MRKLNLDQLEDELEVISSNQLYCIKGGYGSSGGYGNGFYDPFADGYDYSGGGGGGGGSSDWSSVVAAAQNGTLAPGTYTNDGDGTYTYTSPVDDGSEDDGGSGSGLSGSYGGYGDPSITEIGGPGNGNDCVFQCLAYANSKLGGTWSIDVYKGEYDAEYGGDSEDGVDASKINMFATGTNLNAFAVTLSSINGAVPAGEVIMTDYNVSPGQDHEVIVVGVYPDGAGGQNAMILDPQNGNALSAVPISQLGKTNTIGYNGAG